MILNRVIRQAFAASFPLIFFAVSTPSFGQTPSVANTPPPAAYSVSGKIIIQDRKPHFEGTRWEAFAPERTWTNVKVGDFNGDGYSDVLASDKADGSVWVALSNGSDRFVATKWSGITADFDFEHALVGDMNLDGCSDLALLQVDKNQRSTGNLYIALSNCRDSFQLQDEQRLDGGPFKVKKPLFAEINFSRVNQFWVVVEQNNTIRNRLFAPNPYGFYHLTADLDQSMPDVLRIVAFARFVDRDRETALFHNATKGAGNNFYQVGINASNYDTRQRWAEFPWTGSLEDEPLIGDFNGDGLDDILVEGPNKVLGWWISISDSAGALEQPVLGLASEDDLTKERWVGDIDGDGSADVVRKYSPGGDFLVSFARFGKPLAGVRVTVDNSASTVTGENGEYRFAGLNSGKHKITAELEGYSFLPGSRFAEIKGQNRIGESFVANSQGSRSLLGQAVSQGVQPVGPFVCSGYIPGMEDAKWGESKDGCPKGYVYYEVSGSESDINSLRRREVKGSCCKLPFPDILEGEDIQAAGDCPAGYLPTGLKNSPSDADVQPRSIRCSKLNENRYQLGPLTPGVFWGTSLDLKKASPGVVKERIPAAIRSGIGRTAYSEWDNQGCIGYPWGSIFMKNGRNFCSNVLFSQLQYSGKPGDPPKGTPVPMFPECSNIENVFDPTTGCAQ